MPRLITMCFRLCYSIIFSGLLVSHVFAHHDLVNTVKVIKKSVVGVGIFQPLGAPQNTLMGSGFTINSNIPNVTWVVSNYHVISTVVTADDMSKPIVFVGSGKQTKIYKARVVKYDKKSDLVILSIPTALPTLTLMASDNIVADGTEVAFTGFPIGNVLGLYPATHRGIIAAYTPVVIPQSNSSQLSSAILSSLKNPLFTYQLDAVAYPGNSGSVLYDVSSGQVIGVINKVLVKTTKESALTDPSGITYAIPVNYVHELIAKISKH